MREFLKRDPYVLVLNEGSTEYEVINTDTGVVEFKNASLPRCYIVCEEYASALGRLTEKPVEKAPAAVPKNVFRIAQREADDEVDPRG